MASRKPISTSLKGVILASDVYMVCQSHALSTDQEEVMGLLIGEIKDEVSHISALIMLRRSDKRKDRVEISPIQLTHAASYADELQKELGKPMSIVGWYHSHPHITVWPSHVDLGTQAMYQNMEPRFVGIIFSVFTEDKVTKTQEFHMTCFQSLDKSRDGNPLHETVEVPIIIGKQCFTMPCLQTMIKLAEILVEEENEAFELAMGKTSDLSTMSQMMNETVRLYSFLRVTDEVIQPLCSVLDNLKMISTEKLAQDEELTGEQEKYADLFCRLLNQPTSKA